MPTPFYAVECRGEALAGFAARAMPMLGRKDLSFSDWMFGKFERTDGDFPYQCGYSLGYALVKAWLVRAGSTAAKAFGVEAAAVLDAWASEAIDPLKA